MSANSRQELLETVFDIAIKLGVVLLLAHVSYLIARPFLPIILWAVIIAIVLSPLVASIQARFGGRHRKRIVFLLIGGGVLLLLVPTFMLSENVIETSQSLYEVMKEGELSVPPPPESVRGWPLVGEQIHKLWAAASQNLEATLQAHSEQVKTVAQWVVSLVGSGLGTVFIFTLALVVSGVFLLYERQSVDLSRGVFRRLVGDAGDRWADLSAATVRSVVLGLVGIAVFQGVMSLLGMLVMGVPLAAVWAILVLFVAIVQLPPLLVMLPVIFYVFSVADTTPAVLFAIYSVLVSMSDTLLKPILLGRGVAEIPTLVVLVGAIGGMILMGAIGLFVGAVILSLTYLLFEEWLKAGLVDDGDASGQEAS